MEKDFSIFTEKYGDSDGAQHPAPPYLDNAGITDSRTHLRCLEGELERLKVITEALWELLKEKGFFNDEELMERIHQVDMQDGRLDGAKRDKRPVECPNCAKLNNRRHLLCVYCGGPLPAKPF